jgi:hypothetical protein
MPQRAYLKIKHESPFLTIVTRHAPNHRAEKIKANEDSINSQIEKNFEQLIIEDTEGLGMVVANKAFDTFKHEVNGQYVHLLDDDDYYDKDSFTLRMEEVAKANNYPDFIFFKMWIGTGDGDNIYPKPDCWGDVPKIARIGGSCFIVKNEIYQEMIHHFGLRRCGDFNFLKNCFANNPTRVWHDELMCRTGSVGRGKL